MMKLPLALLLVLAAAVAKSEASLQPGHPADVMCFIRSMKYNYCFPILQSDENRDLASKTELCAAKNPGGGPDSWPSQTACCKEFGGCGYSGGPSGRECWVANPAAKRCEKRRLDEPGGPCGVTNNFQLEQTCITEALGGAAVQNRMAPGVRQQQPAPMQDKTAPAPQPPKPQDKMAPAPAPGPPQVTEIKYTGRGGVDLGADADIPSGGQPYTKVCGGLTKAIVACNQTKGCAAFVVETKDIQNPGACAYLKKAGGKVSPRQAWSVFVRS